MIKKLLAIRLSALGDICMTLPVIDSFCRAYPDVELTLLTSKPGAAITKAVFHLPNLQIVAINKKDYSGLMGANRLYKEMRAYHFDAIADLHDVLRTKWTALRFRIAGYPVAVIDKGRGDKKKLLELSLMNGKQYKFDRLKQSEKLNPEQKAVRLMKEIQENLKLPKLPYWIECFDNSNISGADAVAGLVVFKKLKPSKKDYRKFNIKTVEGPDDYASMREVVFRRYSRLIDEGSALPDLIITDGGKGQMGVVKEMITRLGLEIPVAGLAKNDKHRTNELLIFDDNEIVSVGMRMDSELFKLFSKIQDEVHRFAITFHKDKRSKRQIHSELDDIKGIGSKTISTLLKEFKSVKQIRQASLEQLTSVVGASKANIIFSSFKKI